MRRASTDGHWRGRYIRYSDLVIHDQTDMPLAHPNIVWAPLRVSDAEALHRLLAHVEEVEALPYRTSLAEVDAMLRRSTQWEGVAGYLVDDEYLGTPDAEMVTFGYVGLSAGSNDEVVCHGVVMPNHRSGGIGSKVLHWQTRAGARLLERHTEHSQGTLTHLLSASDDDFKAGLSALGYRHEGSVVELRADVESWVPQAVLPPYVEIVPWCEDLDDRARRTFNSVNAQLGSDVRASKSQWQQMNAAMNRDWSFLAVNQEGDRPRVVGLISTGGFEQDWDALGWKEGVLQIVAVFEPDGHDEILRALLDTCMEALVTSGLDKLSVTLDPVEDEPTTLFYRRNGFEVARRFDTYTLTIRNRPRVLPTSPKSSKDVDD